MRRFWSRESGGRGRSGRRSPAARPTGAARPGGGRPAIPERPRDAALGRETRGLVGAAKRRSAAAQPASGAGAGGGAGIGAAIGRLPGIGNLPGRASLPGLPGLPRAGHFRAARRSDRRRLVTPARAAGLLGMLTSGFLLSFVTGPTAFGLTRTELPELAWTTEAEVREALALAEGRNVFALDTAPLEAALLGLPAVAGADVEVTLPDAAVVVRLEERTPVLAWQIGDRRFLADREGAVFAQVAATASLPAGVAVVEDRRDAAAGGLAIGGHLDAVDLDVATRLGSLTPADVGSGADRLRVAATDADGFVLTAPGAWTAVFGFYSPAIRSTDIIPGQVRLLRSLLAGREETLARIILASETDGTYVPVRTPRPSRGG